ncbi:minor capsid protein [Convivina praedatoris]|uniref:Capsid protein n=1 Tax=Convivina praedatoris TaxID=2880963 RepID=A0ABN8HGI8_9LACO|nr:minor capsid protein [Convivina sp. LMG 32447]CAH1853317.1 hypothetical protein R077815_00796 [Convivina sp. LMG 32447]CAH1854685.1 hypothetical protein LMG032447_00910 [Convivina sp. LMG 32447]
MTGVHLDLNGVNKMLQNGRSRGNYLAANQAMLEMNRFVPYSGKQRQNHLRDTAHLSNRADAIIYTTPYAKAQFYGFVGRGGYRVRNYTTPGTSRRWDLRLKGDKQGMNNMINAFRKGMQ